MRGMLHRRGARLVILCAALGCGGLRTPGGPAVTAGRTVHYAPLGLVADARQPGRLVLLGTDATDGSTVLPVPLAPRPVVVDALIEPSDGGAAVDAAITVAVAPAAPGATARGVVDEGGGAAAWSAALVAAAAVGKDLAALSVSATPAGATDDAGGSAALAAGMVAAITGAQIDPSAALVGAIAPNGTIGTVAGIPERWLAATARGKKRLGYPRGARLSRSRATGQQVDLVELARQHGAVAVEVGDLGEAYRLLTRTALPATLPVDEAELAIEPETAALLESQYVAWRHRLSGEWAAVLQLDQVGRLPAPLRRLAELARRHSARAEALHRTGQRATSSDLVVAAWIDAAAANATYGVVTRLAAGDVDGAVAAVAALDPGDTAIAAALGRIGALRPSTLAGHLAMLAAFQAALSAWSDHLVAAELLGAVTPIVAQLRGKPTSELAAPATAERIAHALAPAARIAFRAVAEAGRADDQLELAPEHGVAYSVAPASLSPVAGPLRAAAVASLAQIDAVLVAPLARRAGITEDAARLQLATAEPAYLVATALARRAKDGLPARLAASWGEHSIAASLLALADGALAYHSAASVLAAHDAFALRADDAGRPAPAERGDALRGSLDGAARAARSGARAARIATGAIPVQARLAYQRASIAATGEADDQLAALTALWTASAWCEAAVTLARN